MSDLRNSVPLVISIDSTLSGTPELYLYNNTVPFDLALWRDCICMRRVNNIIIWFYNDLYVNH